MEYCPEVKSSTIMCIVWNPDLIVWILICKTLFIECNEMWYEEIPDIWDLSCFKCPNYAM